MSKTLKKKRVKLNSRLNIVEQLRAFFDSTLSQAKRFENPDIGLMMVGDVVNDQFAKVIKQLKELE